MKTLKMKWLPLFLLVAIGLLLPACEGNNPDDDLAGVITLKMRNSENGGTSLPLADHNYLHITKDNNFSTSSGGFQFLYISDVGKKKLSAVKSVPSSGWTTTLAVIPEHSYVLKEEQSEFYEDGFGGQSIRGTGKYKYYKLYVVDYIKSTSGGIIGAEVQYCEWNPEQ